ncbi:MAG: thiamine pyrophosphate-binding protein, partial [Pedococcus sp.]
MAEPGTNPVTGGAAVIDALVAHGVRDVFGIPGTHNLELYRYLPTSGIRHVVTRHEQGAGYAADGYARITGQPGVIITTSGPGITNAITALATAYADSIPVLAISPGPPRGQVRADVGWLHEVKDQQAALDAVTGRSIRVESADEIPEVLAAVFEEFATTRPRPVHLEVPVDVLEGEWLRRPAPVRSVPAGPWPSRSLPSSTAPDDLCSSPVAAHGAQWTRSAPSRISACRCSPPSTARASSTRPTQPLSVPGSGCRPRTAPSTRRTCSWWSAPSWATPT